jgi:hypothetical protein
MPDPRRIQVLVEGPDDRAVLEGLRKLGLLPPAIEVAKPTKEEGNSAVLEGAAARALAGVSCITMLDFDHHPTPAALAEWAASGLRDRLRRKDPAASVVEDAEPSPRVRLLHVSAGARNTKAAVVAVGLVGDPELHDTYALERFAIDDFLLRLVRVQPIFENISDLHDRLPHATAMKKLDRTIEVLREDDGHAVGVTTAKRVLFLLRAIADFRAATATFAGRLFDVAAKTSGGSPVRALFEPLVGDLEAAVSLLG